MTLFHVDLYRLEDPREIEDLGLSEIAGDGVLVIEWAERLPSAPRDAIRVRLEHAADDARKVTIDDSAVRIRTNSQFLIVNCNFHSDR